MLVLTLDIASPNRGEKQVFGGVIVCLYVYIIFYQCGTGALYISPRIFRLSCYSLVC